MEEKDQLNLREAAKLLGVTYPTLATWCKKRKDLPHVRVGKAYRFPRKALMEWAGHQNDPAPDEGQGPEGHVLQRILRDVQRAKQELEEAEQFILDIM